MQMLLIALRQIMPVLPFSEITFFNKIVIIWNGIPEDIKVANTQVPTQIFLL